ncbi:helix-turn-helix domain-containing protein [Streptomyces sp. NPDC002754]
MQTNPIYRAGTNAKFSMSMRAAVVTAELTLGAFAPLLGVSSTSVSYRVNGKAPWRLEDIDKIADVFDIPPTQMLAGPGEWLNSINPANVQARLKAVSPRPGDTDT